MKRIAINGLLLLLMLPFAILAQTTYEVKSHSLVVEGTSNLHDWTAEVEKVNGTFNIRVENGKLVDIERLSVRVDAQSFNSSKGSMMNSKIFEALNTKRHPEITFELRKVNSISENPGTYRVNTSGMLKISGVTKPVTLSALGRVVAGGDIEFTGTTKLKMSDFNVNPPRAMFGALTTGDEITLTYTIVLQPNQLTEK